MIPPDTHQLGHTSFGFGRRSVSLSDSFGLSLTYLYSVCAGMYFAEQGLWTAIATLLWTFDLRPPADNEGNPILPPLDEWVDSGIAT